MMILELRSVKMTYTIDDVKGVELPDYIFNIVDPYPVLMLFLDRG